MEGYYKPFERILNKICTEYVRDQITLASKELHISKKVMIRIWNNLYPNYYLKIPNVICIYQMTTGELCGKNISSQSDEYCGIHATIMEKRAKGEKKEENIKKKKEKKILLKKSLYNKGYYVHEKTGLLFSADKKVIGKEIINKEIDKEVGDIGALSSTDLETCKKYRFKIRDDCEIEQD